jgi:hypothetical protein
MEKEPLLGTTTGTVPIVYREEYNITACGLEVSLASSSSLIQNAEVSSIRYQKVWKGV